MKTSFKNFLILDLIILFLIASTLDLIGQNSKEAFDSSERINLKNSIFDFGEDIGQNFCSVSKNIFGSVILFVNDSEYIEDQRNENIVNDDSFIRKGTYKFSQKTLVLYYDSIAAKLDYSKTFRTIVVLEKKEKHFDLHKCKDTFYFKLSSTTHLEFGTKRDEDENDYFQRLKKDGILNALLFTE